MKNNSIKPNFLNTNKNSLILNKIIFILYLLYFLVRILTVGYKYFLYNMVKYFTSWVIMSIFFYSFFRLLMKTNSEKLDIFFNIIFPTAFFICFFYWLLVFPFLKKEEYYKSYLEIVYIEFTEHILPLIYVILEFFLNRNILFKYINIFYILIFSFIYTLMNIIFVFILKDIPYNVLNYKNINTLIIFSQGYAFLFIVFFFFRILEKNISKLRLINFYKIIIKFKIILL